MIRNEIPKAALAEKESISQESIHSSTGSHGIIQQFQPFQEQLLTVEELDKVLDIDHLTNPDHKKVKRSRLIREVNDESQKAFGQPLIIRKKNQEDKRYLLYEISTNVIPEEGGKE